MSIPRIAAALLTIGLVGCTRSEPRADQVPREILELEKQRREAQLQGDWKAIQKINAPDFTEIAGAGTIRTAAQNAEAMRSGMLKFDSVEYSEQQVLPYDNVAIVTGVAHRSGSYDGKPFRQQARFSRIYVRQKGGWRAVFAQNTPIDTTR